MSTAKVLAMGLNCEKGPTPEPDGTCPACRAIINNTSVDVLEMDAASNRGIDEIRDLRDKVNLAPAQGRSKVYIIDEVHMLTTEAFNALLKMLEEPPEHVVFVLATTEKHKVPATIISRCQSFDFRRPGVALLAEKLGEIAEAEGIEAEPAALTLIAREGRGSFRDAEGLLDQLSSFADGPVTAALVRELLGSTGSEVLLETTDALHEGRTADALRVVDRLQNEGRDLGRFAVELVAHLRRLMLLPHAPEVALADVGEDEREGLQAQAERVTTAWVMRAISALDGALARARRGGDAKLELELTFLGLTRDYTEPSVDALLERIEALEKALENGAAVVARVPAAGGVGGQGDATRGEPAPASPPPSETSPVDTPDAGGPEGEEASPPDVGDEPEVGDPREDTPSAGDGDAGGAATPALPDWGLVMAELKGRRKALTAAVYQEARVGAFDGETLTLVYPEEQAFHVGMARDGKHTDELGKVLEERLGKRPRLEFLVGDGDAALDAEPRGDGPRGGPPPLQGSSRPQTPPESRGSGAEPGAQGSGAAPLRGRGDLEGIALARDPVGDASGERAARPQGVADDRIRAEREVFALARERFGTLDNP